MINPVLLERIEQLPPEKQKRIEAMIEDALKEDDVQDILPRPVTKFTGEIKPGFGGAKGFFGELSDGFDEPLDDMKNAQPQSDKRLPREFGGLRGFVKHIADDFDEPLDDFKEYM